MHIEERNGDPIISLLDVGLYVLFLYNFFQKGMI